MRAKFWSRFLIPENVSAVLLNVLAVSTVGIMGLIMIMAPTMPGIYLLLLIFHLLFANTIGNKDFEKQPMIKEDGSTPFRRPIFPKDGLTNEERWQNFVLEKKLVERIPPQADKE